MQGSYKNILFNLIIIHIFLILQWLAQMGESRNLYIVLHKINWDLQNVKMLTKMHEVKYKSTKKVVVAYPHYPICF